MKADEATRRQMTIETYGVKRVPRRRVVVRGEDRDTAELAVPVVVVGQGAFARAYDADELRGGGDPMPGLKHPACGVGGDVGEGAEGWHAAGLVVCGWVLAVGLVAGVALGWLAARATG